MPTCKEKTKKKIEYIRNSNAYAYYKVLKNLLDNITTFLALFASLNLLNSTSNISQNSTSLSMNISTNTPATVQTTASNTNNNEILHIIMMGLCTLFGLIRIFNDFLNLCKFGKNEPGNAPKGNYIGVFGEDLALLCVEVIRGVESTTAYNLVSSIYSAFNFSYTALIIILKMLVVGVAQTLSGEGDLDANCCIIKFLCFVGASGFYVLYRWVSVTIEPSTSQVGDMYILYVVYMIVSFLHSLVLWGMLKDYKKFSADELREAWR
jgi:hypothetical protein